MLGMDESKVALSLKQVEMDGSIEREGNHCMVKVNI